MIESGFALSSSACALRDDVAAEASGARPEVDHVLGAADGVLVVLDHDQRVALGAEARERVEQDLVVARVQADGRLVEDVADAAQVGAQLRREADALRLAARERRRAAIEREVAQPHLLQEAQARDRARRGCRARSPARGPATASFSKNVCAFEIGCALMSAIDLAAEAHRERLAG